MTQRCSVVVSERIQENQSGIDPLEIFDFAAGLIFLDPLGDDY